MKSNPMRAALERGELQLGTWINLIRNPAVLPLLKAAKAKPSRSGETCRAVN